jgi:hypothetical protein
MDEAKVWQGPPVEAWSGAWGPEQAAARLAPGGAVWCVVGGWAIDLFLGRQTRAHGDLEVAVLLSEFDRVRACFADCALYTPHEGEVRALPDHAAPTPERHQTWVADPAVNEWRIDLMAEPGDAHTWAYRRDPSLTAPRAQMVGVSATGIPYLRPHGVLLFKAKALRPKDLADFALCLPLMDARERKWLAAALERFHPGHAWIEQLA